MLLLVCGLPVFAGAPEQSQKQQAKTDVVQISTAVVAYETEYGHLPGKGSGVVGGEILAALLGKMNSLNPRSITFLEAPPAQKGKSGLLNGVFVDPWGGAYQIVYGPNAEGKVIAGTDHQEIKKKAGVWNDPSLGEDGAKLTEAEKRARYVTSWD